MKVLEDLWYGNIIPFESFMKNSRNLKKLVSRIDKDYDNLTDTLSKEQKELLEKYENSVDEMHSVSEQAAFQYGFSLGVRLMVESGLVDLAEGNG